MPCVSLNSFCITIAMELKPSLLLPFLDCWSDLRTSETIHLDSALFHIIPACILFSVMMKLSESTCDHWIRS
jgi:hypothetical protein